MATMRPQRSKNLLCSLIMSCVSSVGGAEGTSGGVGGVRGRNAGIDKKKRKKKKGAGSGFFGRTMRSSWSPHPSELIRKC